MWSRASSANRHRRRRTWLRVVALAVVAAVLARDAPRRDRHVRGRRPIRSAAGPDRSVHQRSAARSGGRRDGPRHAAADPRSRRRRPTPTPVRLARPGGHAEPDAGPDPDADPDAAQGGGRRRHRREPQEGLRPRAARTPGARRPASRWRWPCWAWPTRRMASSASSSHGSSEWESYDDSHNGLWGPHAMALALEAYGAPGYEVRGYDSRLGALRDAAKAIQATDSPVHPAGLARRPHLGHDRVQGRLGPVRLPVQQDPRRLHPRPVVSVELEHLGPVRSARDVPGRCRDGPELPAVEAARGPLPGSRRPVHRGRTDAQGAGRADGRSGARAPRGRPRAARPWRPSRRRSRTGSRGSRPRARGAGWRRRRPRARRTRRATWRSVSWVAYSPRESG